MILLAYTATYMPYKTCFVDDSSMLAETVDWTVDVLFAVDILINFLSAIEKDDNTLITEPKEIAKLYLKTWFTFDLISVLPFSLIEKVIPKPEESVPGQGSS